MSESLNQIPPPALETSTALQTTAPPATQLATALPTTAANLTAFDASTQAATTATTGLTNALPMPIDGLNNLGAVSSSAAGQVGSMGDAAGAVAGALSSKAAEISSIHISVPTVSTVPIAAPVPVAANAAGGIYQRGAFLTTFAEKSAEAAIPLDGSQRAVNLWAQAGQMLGVLPGDNSDAIVSTPTFNTSSGSSFNVTINITIAGNADESTVRRGIEQALPQVEDWASRLTDYQRERRRRSFA